VVIRALRASMLEVLGADYITTARSKGVAGLRLLVRHVLRNAVIPAITVLGVNIAWVIGGAVIVEDVFALPGIGDLMVQSIFARDFPVAQAVTLVFGVLGVLVNLLTDVSYAVLDPRVRFTHWELTTIPGIAVVVTGLALSLLGDGLTDLLRPGRSSPTRSGGSPHTRTSSPAGSGSGSRSPARSRSRPTCSSRTSRCPRSTSACRPRS